MIRFFSDHANISVLGTAVFFAVLQLVWWPLTCRLRVHLTRAVSWWHGVAR